MPLRMNTEGYWVSGGGEKAGSSRGKSGFFKLIYIMMRPVAVSNKNGDAKLSLCYPVCSDAAYASCSH